MFFLIDLFGFKKIVKLPLENVTFIFRLYIGILRLFKNTLCTLVSSSETIIIKYSCDNHSFKTNEVLRFNAVGFNIALFDVALF